MSVPRCRYERADLHGAWLRQLLATDFPSFLALIDTYDTCKSGLVNFVAVALALNELGYTAKGYIINMSTTQMAVLLLFDQTDSLSYVELQVLIVFSSPGRCLRNTFVQETTKLADDQFPRYVQSLLDAKLLTINSETLTPDSVVSLNLKSVKNIV